jgi:predicted nucleotidyltransferase
MEGWPGRAHVESLRLWPDLVEAVARIESYRELYAGVLLIGSLARGEGDAISDVDLVAVTQTSSSEFHPSHARRSTNTLPTFAKRMRSRRSRAPTTS